MFCCDYCCGQAGRVALCCIAQRIRRIGMVFDVVVRGSLRSYSSFLVEMIRGCVINNPFSMLLSL